MREFQKGTQRISFTVSSCNILLLTATFLEQLRVESIQQWLTEDKSKREAVEILGYPQSYLTGNM